MSSHRVLWLPYGQHGAVLPIAPVINQLRERGADVVMLGQPGLERMARSLAVRFEPYATSDIAYDWSIRDGRDQHGHGPQKDPRWFEERVRAEVDETDRMMKLLRPDLCLVDSFVVGGGFAAEIRGIPWASYVHYLFDESADVDAMFRIWWEVFGEDVDAYCAWWNGLRRSVGLRPERRSVAEAPWYRMSPLVTILLGHPALKRGARPRPGYVTSTSLPPWDADGSPERRPTAERNGSPRVLVSNSSAWQPDLELVRAALEALAGMEAEVIVTVSAEHQLDVEVPPNAQLRRFLPHTQVLPHMDAVITTGGYGLVSKSLWWGLPVIVAPYGRDQPYVAEAVERTSCGVKIAWPPDPDAVARAVSIVLESEDIRRCANRLSGPVRGCPGPDDVTDLLLKLGGGG